MIAPVPRARPADQVMWPLAPEPGESLLGFAARTAHHNVLPSGYTILRRAGHTDLQRAYASLEGDVDVETIARALAVKPVEVLSRRLPAADASGFVLLHHQAVRREDVVTHLRRFSPARLQADGLHYATSMLKTLPFCPETWDYLRDKCTGCGRVQAWRSARDLRRCDACGERLADQGANSVPEALRPGLAIVAGFIHSDPAIRNASLSKLAPGLAHLSGGEAFELALTVLYIAHPELGIERPIVIDPVEQAAFTQSLATIAQHLAGFPGPLLEDFTAKLASAKRQGTSAHKRFTGAMSGRLRNGHLPAVTAAMRDAVADVRDGNHPEVAGYFDAAEDALGRSYRLIASARANGVFKNRLVYTGSRFRLGFDRQELEELGAVHGDRRGVEMAAIDLLLPMYAIPQLAAYDLLTVHSHGWWHDQFGMDQTTKAAVASFKAELRGAASTTATIKDPIQLSWAMRAFGGGPKPWGAALHALIVGGVPFELTGPEKTNYVVISRADVGRCCPVKQGAGLAEYSQRDALDILNCNLRYAPLLAGNARTGLGRSAWRLPADGLMEIARACVTAGELSARIGIHSNKIARNLRDLDVPEALIGWRRDEAEAALAPLLGHAIGGRLLVTSECA